MDKFPLHRSNARQILASNLIGNYLDKEHIQKLKAIYFQMSNNPDFVINQYPPTEDI